MENIKKYNIKIYQISEKSGDQFTICHRHFQFLMYMLHCKMSAFVIVFTIFAYGDFVIYGLPPTLAGLDVLYKIKGFLL